MRHRPLAAAIAVLFTVPAHAADATVNLNEIVVTAPRMLEPLTVMNDPKAPQQPVPANDGAAFLKNIPGFEMIRKGGTDGDPVLRGLAGSRLNLLVDGAELLGGCGMRMDPPTAYVFPEIYDQVTVLKGPQSVSNGNGNLAGTVLFERDAKKLQQPGARGSASLMAGSWGRLDALATGTYGGDKGYVQGTVTHAESDDYQDGSGREVHSAYQRQSLDLVGGWAFDPDTKITVNAIGSKAEAAYADRTMDGVRFDRQGYGVKLAKSRLSSVVQKVEAQAYYSYIDHVMDNFSLRVQPGTQMVNNPDRETQGLRLSTDLDAGATSTIKVGIDWQGNLHTLRKANGVAVTTYESQSRIRDYEADMTGLYTELRHELADGSRLTGGLRYDSWSADRYNSTSSAVIGGSEADLRSGFVRYEQDLKALPATAFVGLGHAERPMDYWEANTYNGIVSATSALTPEKSTQLDAGLIWKTQDVTASASLFYGKINNYLLTAPNLTSGTVAGIACTTMQPCGQALNVDATRYGGEADFAWRFAPTWTLRGNLSYVHGANDTMGVPLAQTPPLDGRLGLDYASGAWSVGGVLRMVAEQDRVHVGYGNIVGQDIGTSKGFATLALNTAYKPNKKLMVSGGVDNVFDKTYAEHISRNGAAVSGFTTTTRVNEPGRFVWAKLNVNFD